MTGPNSAPTLPGAALLDGEQPDEHEQRDRNDVGLEGGRGDLEALDRRQHRDRRRDRAVAVEERGAEEAQQHQHARARRDRARARSTSAISAMMPPSPLLSARMMKIDVLDRHDDHQRPEDERQDAEHVVLGDRHRVVRAAEDFLQRVERAGADVAIDDAQRARAQGWRGAWGPSWRVVSWGGRYRHAAAIADRAGGRSEGVRERFYPVARVKRRRPGRRRDRRRAGALACGAAGFKRRGSSACRQRRRERRRCRNTNTS